MREGDALLGSRMMRPPPPAGRWDGSFLPPGLDGSARAEGSRLPGLRPRWKGPARGHATREIRAGGCMAGPWIEGRTRLSMNVTLGSGSRVTTVARGTFTTAKSPPADRALLDLSSRRRDACRTFNPTLPAGQDCLLTRTHCPHLGRQRGTA